MARVAGTVVARMERRTRTGSKMGIIGLSDPSGHYEAVVFSEGLQQFRDLLEPGSAVLLTLSLTAMLTATRHCGPTWSAAPRRTTLR